MKEDYCNERHRPILEVAVFIFLEQAGWRKWERYGTIVKKRITRQSARLSVSFFDSHLIGLMTCRKA